MIDKYNNIVSGDYPDHKNITTVDNSHTTDDTWYQSIQPLDLYSLYPVFKQYRGIDKKRDLMDYIRLDGGHRRIKSDLLKLAVGNVTESEFFKNYPTRNKTLIKKILKFVRRKNNLNESNRQLRGRKTLVPNYIIKEIEVTLKNVGDNKPNGWQFAKNIVKDPLMTYENLKRKLHIFQRIEDMDCIESRLMGGQQMLDFIEKTLANWRTYAKHKKTAKQRAGFSNSHLGTHTKN